MNAAGCNKKGMKKFNIWQSTFRCMRTRKILLLAMIDGEILGKEKFLMNLPADIVGPQR
jgi:hypothetical protein